MTEVLPQMEAVRKQRRQILVGRPLHVLSHDQGHMLPDKKSYALKKYASAMLCSHRIY